LARIVTDIAVYDDTSAVTLFVKVDSQWTLNGTGRATSIVRTGISIVTGLAFLHVPIAASSGMCCQRHRARKQHHHHELTDPANVLLKRSIPERDVLVEAVHKSFLTIGVDKKARKLERNRCGADRGDRFLRQGNALKTRRVMQRKGALRGSLSGNR
jgi:hypothetical protein